ncbi:TPA: PilL N-terminal domain-containing protein [Pseudomonas aeruginosa]|uniref:PFGI-1 class ICE element type IV pilus protein PilL2 n=1 Tax=Pseudomonas TaxID=286 RepID=UPI00295158A8|nr:integrating conjugative element protein pill, pfgi-1 [Pseudomonas aeruginosa]MCO3283390.1 integrating conjugative element protein pill, pfgi-1 [Pseudomonas aeruginosa]MDV6624215.1 integrating conjugative element protein pill, pfgi-1 [Pseudomonas aeruginosa]HBO9203567.1 integrating conjugative element protein pill, pfgi-1 [Pseudomonas aeruginosa]HCE6538934.1 PilL N-terminal domain-containing protein [Pseudomonas aeruginosa]
MCPSSLWFHPSERRLLAGFLGLLWSVLAGGCATTTAPVTPDTIEEVLAAPESEAPEHIPVVRYGRYTLVQLAATAAQRDLLLQTIDVSMPEDARATVGDGLRHVLKRSGYQLCETAHAVIELYALPLPAAHLHLGPMTLRDALLTLAGSAWELHADDGARQVCFERLGDGASAAPTPEPFTAEAMQTFPVMPSMSGGQP